MAVSPHPLLPTSSAPPEPPRAPNMDDRLTPARNGGDTCWLSVAWHLSRLAGMHEGTGPCGFGGEGHRECADGRCGLAPLEDFIQNGSDWESVYRSYRDLTDTSHAPGLTEREREWLSREVVRTGEPQQGLLALASLTQRHAHRPGEWVKRHCWRGLEDRVVRLCDNHLITSPIAQTEPDIVPGAMLALAVFLEDQHGERRRTLAEGVERVLRPWPEDACAHLHPRTTEDGGREVSHNCLTITHRESRERAAPERAFIQLARGQGFETQAPFIPGDAEWLDIDGLWAGGESPTGPSHRLRAAAMWIGGFCEARQMVAGHYFLFARAGGGWYTLGDGDRPGSEAPYHTSAPEGGPFDEESEAHATLLLYERVLAPACTAASTEAAQELRALVAEAGGRLRARGLELAEQRRAVESGQGGGWEGAEGWRVWDVDGGDWVVEPNGPQGQPERLSPGTGVRAIERWCRERPREVAGEGGCAVCSAALDDPIAAPCGHVFCRGCLAHHSREHLQAQGVRAESGDPMVCCATCLGTWRVQLAPAVPRGGAGGPLAEAPEGSGSGRGGTEGGAAGTTPPDGAATQTPGSAAADGEEEEAEGAVDWRAGTGGGRGRGCGGRGERGRGRGGGRGGGRGSRPAGEGQPARVPLTDLQLTPEYLRGTWVCPVVVGCQVGVHTHEHDAGSFAAALLRARGLETQWEERQAGSAVGQLWDVRLRAAWKKVIEARATVVAKHLRQFHRNMGDSIAEELGRTLGVVPCDRCRGFYPGAGLAAHQARCKASGREGLGTARGPQFGRALVRARAGPREGGAAEGGEGEAAEGDGAGGGEGATGDEREGNGAGGDGEGGGVSSSGPPAAALCFAVRLPQLMAEMAHFSLDALSHLPGRTSRAPLADEAARRAGAEILEAVLNFCNHATDRGDKPAVLLGLKFTAVLGHLAFPEPHRHLAANAKKQGKDVRRAREKAAFEALRRTLTMTPGELREWLTERVARLEPGAERDPPPADTKEEELAKLVRKVQRHVAHNELSKAAGELPGMTALQEGGDADVMRAGRLLRLDDELRARLQALHPAPPAGAPPVPQLPEDRNAFEPTPGRVFKALKSFPRSTGLGPSGFPVQALKSLCTRDVTAEGAVDSVCLLALTEFVGHIVRGSMPPEVMAMWASARLLALTKANGKPRPIAVGEIFRRLAAKCAVMHCAKVLAARLRPTQRGVGVSGGVEHLAHTITVMLQTHPDWCVLAVDVKNAFNSILRESILRETITHLPEVADLIFGCYGGLAPKLWLSSSDFIESLRGVQQGDPLGPALFALAFHPVLLRVKELHPDVRVMAGHDDVFMVGTPADCVAAYVTFAAEAGCLGLTVDASESRIFSHGEGTVEQAGHAYDGVAVPVPHTGGVVVFGTPIGHPEWVQMKLRELLSTHRVALRALPLVGSTQVSQHLIAASHSARVAHLLRTLPPSVSEAFALAHDDQMWVAFGHVLGYLTPVATRAALRPIVENGTWPERHGHWLQTAMGEQPHAVVHGPKASEADWALRQARLRRRDGGCSVGDAHSTRKAAFVGSWALAVQEGVLEDFPEVGAAVGAAQAERCPHVAALAEAWGSVARWLPEGSMADCTGGPRGHTDHGGLACLLDRCPTNAATGAEPGETVGRFSLHLQKRLMETARTEALAVIYDDMAIAWQSEPTEDGRRTALERWGRMIATSGAYAHASLTALPGDGEEPGHRNLDSRTMSVWLCFRLGIPPPLIGGMSRLKRCELHGCEQILGDARGCHFVHCGRLTPHIMHSSLEDAFAYVAQSVPGLRVKIEVAVFAGSGSRMDVVITSPLGEVQTLFVDVTMGTAMGDVGYGGSPRVSFHKEEGWRGVAGKAARRAESGKEAKYAARVRAAGAAAFEGACVEDFGAFGKGALSVLQWIADAAFGPGKSQVKDLFRWKAAQHIGVAAARSVVAAHDENVLKMRDMSPAVLLARYGPGGPRPTVMEEAREGVADRGGWESRSQAAPSSRRSAGMRRRAPLRGGAPSSGSRTNTLSYGAANDDLRMGADLPGSDGRQGAGPLFRAVVRGA